MSKPNFRIIENYHAEVDYDSFKEDFLNPYMCVDEIKNKYGMTNSDWKEYRSKVLEDTGLKRKPSYTYGKLHYIHDKYGTGNYIHNGKAEYIQKKTNGYIIVKKWGKNAKYYGRYKDYDTAKYVRDKLVECDWDYTIGVQLMDKYSVHSKRKPSLETAKLVYNQFEDLYFHSDLKVTEILEKLGIGGRVYSYLVRMIRDNHPHIVNRPRSRV